MGATIIVDAFWGDAGKGKFAAFLSLTETVEACARAGVGPNAGHSIFRGGKLIKTRLLPLGLVSPNAQLLIGPGVAVDPDVLLEEIATYGTSDRTLIDYRCPVILPEHLVREKADPTMRMIDSTMSGSGAARSDYLLRVGKRAESVPSLHPFLTDVAKLANEIATKGTLIVEGSQGTFLSVYLSDRYPYTTSDNCTTAAFLDDIGLSWKLVERVILLVKCLPTAVGAGPLPNEMSADEIERRGLVEFGTNTGRRRRRVNGIDRGLLEYAVMVNGPTEIALTHCDQFDPDIRDCRNSSRITPKLLRLMHDVTSWTSIPVRYLETGKDHLSIIKVE